MSLPKWAEKMTDDWIDEGNHTHQDVINLREALTIAVEAMSLCLKEKIEIKQGANTYYSHNTGRLEEAIRRIEALGK